MALFQDEPVSSRIGQRLGQVSEQGNFERLFTCFLGGASRLCLNLGCVLETKFSPLNNADFNRVLLLKSLLRFHLSFDVLNGLGQPKN